MFLKSFTKPSCEEGKSLSPKVSYSITLEPNRTYVQHFIYYILYDTFNYTHTMQNKNLLLYVKIIWKLTHLSFLPIHTPKLSVFCPFKLRIFNNITNKYISIKVYDKIAGYFLF